MNPKMYGIEHISYIMVTSVLFGLLLIILKRHVKTDKQIEGMFHIIGVIGLVSIVTNRVFVATFLENNLLYLIPETVCGTCSLMTAIALTFFKKDNDLLQIIWLIALIGDIATFAYPDFIGQGSTIFYPPTITGLWHHSWTMFSLVCVFAFGYLKPDLHKAWLHVYAIMYVAVVGSFLIFIGKFPDAFYLKVPAIGGTLLYLPFMAVVYSVIYLIILTIISHRQKKNSSK